MWPFLSRKDMQKELEASEQRVLSRLATVDELVAQIKKEIIPDQQPRPGELRLQQLPKEVAYLRRQIQEIHTMLSRISPVSPHGEKKSPHQDIRDHIQLATNALEAIGQTYTLCLEEYVRRLDQSIELMQVESDKHDQGQSVVQQVLLDMRPSSGVVESEL